MLQGRPAELGYRQEMLALAVSNGLSYWGTVSRQAGGMAGRAMWAVESFFDPQRWLISNGASASLMAVLRQQRRCLVCGADRNHQHLLVR